MRPCTPGGRLSCGGGGGGRGRDAVCTQFNPSSCTERTSSNFCSSSSPNTSKGAPKYTLANVGMQTVPLLSVGRGDKELQVCMINTGVQTFNNTLDLQITVF